MYLLAINKPIYISQHISNNTDISNLIRRILPLWLSSITIFILFSVLLFKELSYVIKCFLIILIPYTIAFFLKGNIWELSKYYPAFYIMSISFSLYFSEKNIK